MHNHPLGPACLRIHARDPTNDLRALSLYRLIPGRDVDPLATLYVGALGPLYMICF